MSGSLLDTVLPTGIFATGWRARLRPASFRGVEFKVVEASGEEGRLLALHLFPLRESHTVEDLGRAIPRLSIIGYVIGPDYPAQRDALRQALIGTGAPGTLVHPTFGQRRVRCESVRYTESMKEGGICAFDMAFVEDAPAAISVGAPDRFVLALRQVGTALRLARDAYALVAAARGDLAGFARDTLIGWASATAQDLAGAWLGLPGLDLLGTARSIEALRTTTTSDATTFAAQVTAPAEALAAIPAPASAAVVSGGGAGETAGASRPEASDAGRIGNLLLARLAVLPPADDPAARAAALEREAAAIAAASALLQAPWSTATAALDARDRLGDALLTVADAAADRGDADLSIALGALLALTRADLTDRAARLPDIARYDLPATLPALALAQRLHADAARGDGLVALNAARHPAFMPAAGSWLP